MIAKPNGLLLILLIILLTHSISYFLQKNVSDFCFVRLSSFFAHNLFTNLQYDKTIKNNNRFLIDFFHTFLSLRTGNWPVLFIPFFKNSKILLDKILKVYYNRRHNACPHITDIIYMNFSERRRRKEVTFIDAFQRVTGWWEVMC